MKCPAGSSLNSGWDTTFPPLCGGSTSTCTQWSGGTIGIIFNLFFTRHQKPINLYPHLWKQMPWARLPLPTEEKIYHLRGAVYLIRCGGCRDGEDDEAITEIGWTQYTINQPFLLQFRKLLKAPYFEKHDWACSGVQNKRPSATSDMNSWQKTNERSWNLISRRRPEINNREDLQEVVWLIAWLEVTLRLPSLSTNVSFLT